MSNKALTLVQPWATAILYGPKRIENRVWKPPAACIGQRLWIHAGARWRTSSDEFGRRWRFLDDRESSVQSAIMGDVLLLGWVKRDGSFDGDLTPSQVRRAVASPWFADADDVYGWVLTDPRVLREPVSVKGALRVWTVPPRVLAKLRSARPRRP